MKFALGIAVAVSLCAGAAQAGTLTFDFGSVTGDLGQTHTYTVGGLSVIASAFGPNLATGAPDHLYGKSNGGDEVGLGMTNDTTGDHEIQVGRGYIQLDVSALFGKIDPLSAIFSMNSTTDNETWVVYGSNIAGTIGSAIISGGASPATGTDEGTHLLPSFGTYNFYDFIETANSGGRNVLLHNLTVTTAVPEPASWALMIAAFAGLGFATRRRRVIA